MSQRLSNSFVNTVVPGAYPNVKVITGAAGVGATGNIVIIGEADGGLDFSQEVLADNYFTPDQADVVAQKYIKGNIVDAMRAIAAPSNDTDIQGSASRIYIMKTNVSTKATSLLGSYGSLAAKIAGKDGNKYSYKILQSQAEVGPSITSTDLTAALATPAVFDGLTFKVRLNGSAVTTVTLSSTSSDHDTIAKLAAEIDGLLPSGMECVVATGNTLTIQSSVDSLANQKGYGKSFELIDYNPGDLAVVGLDEDIYVSSAEPAVEISVLRPDISVNETMEASADVALTIGYDGLTASLVITETQLSTTVIGGSGTDLSLSFSDFTTIGALADYINAQSGYKATALTGSSNLAPSSLDNVSISIASSLLAQPGRVKKGAANFEKAMLQSASLDVTVDAAAQGLPDATAAYVFLAGGDKGSTTSAAIVNALTALEGIEVNFVVPLFSRDSSADIADGLTESSSTYTIDAIHAAVKSHVLKMSTTKLKKNRIAMVSYKGSFTNAKSKAAALASYRAILCMQDAKQVDSQGAVKTYQPWFLSCVAAGMQSAGFYKGLVKKFANVISFVDPTGFDSGKPGDVESALEAGILFMEKATAGNRWVSDQSTYGLDTNFVYNSLQATYLADVLAIDLSKSLETAYVGKSLADVDAGTVLSFLSNKMDIYKKSKVISASDDAPAGYKNVKISINGPVLEVSVEVKLSTSIYFIPLNISISQISQTAGA